jgi:hypothetical protein
VLQFEVETRNVFCMMIIDHGIVKALLQKEEKTVQWLETHPTKPVSLRWPCLLSYLGEDFLFSLSSMCRYFVC